VAKSAPQFTARAGTGDTRWRLLLAGAAAMWVVTAAGLMPVGAGRALTAAGGALLALAAMRYLPGAPPHLSGQGRTLVDGLIVAGSGLLIAWAAGLGAIRDVHPNVAAAVALPLAYLGVSATALVVLTRARPAARERFAWLAAGYGLIAASGVLQASGALDSLRWAAAIAVGSAGWAVVWWGAGRHPTLGAIDGLRPGLPTRASVLIPSLPFAAAVLATAANAANHGLRAFVIWNAAIVGVLVIARQVLALLENIAFWRELEATVRARTSELTRSEARFRSLVQNSSDVITVIGTDGTVRYESPSTHAVLGHSVATFGPGPPLEIVHPEDRDRVRAAAHELRDRSASVVRLELRVRHRDHGWRYVEAVASNLLDDEAVAAFVINTRDITAHKALAERRVLEAEPTHRAVHDALTGLANRALFSDRLEHAVSRSSRQRSAVAVLFLDLDDFKDVNDTLGHAAGDDLLATVARRLDETVRPADTVARLGGDEFAILIEDVTDVDDVSQIVERIHAALKESITVRGREVFVRCSIGIATSGADNADAQELLRNADIAMYTAKARGGSGYALFELGMRAVLLERIELENDLRQALERDEFLLHYQPIVSLRSGEVRAVEALVRWRRPGQALTSPHQFIRVAERTGLIVPLGRWVLGQACKQVRGWSERFPRPRGLGLNVNISARQLQSPELATDVKTALDASQLSPSRLVLEITESFMIAEGDPAITRVEELRAIGVRVAIDDFGTGYSSLGYLRDLPVDELKIDRRFIEGLTAGSRQAALIRAIVTMSGELGIVPIAEGVERPGQADMLRELGCNWAQGHHLVRPTAPEDPALLLALSGQEHLRVTGSPRRDPHQAWTAASTDRTAKRG
jgi:diguanylate cyclase (GGDEF)-like protein/PAS domain S-box-containing protein